VVSVGLSYWQQTWLMEGETAMTTDCPDVQTTLAQALQEFAPEGARIVVGDQAVAVWLGGVLSPAERQMAGSRTGREMLERVGELILEQARPQLLHLVEGSTFKDAILTDVHLDVANGNLVGLFSLE
jgi:hypothetical protein